MLNCEATRHYWVYKDVGLKIYFTQWGRRQQGSAVSFLLTSIVKHN
jgi:hypothetical protein